MSFLRPEDAERDDSWHPRLDLYQTPNGWVIKVDLAGMRSEDIAVSVSGSTVEVSGVRRDLTVNRNWSCYSMEIAYNRFSRTVHLPCQLGDVELMTEYQEGMLLIHLLCEVTQS